MSEDTPNVLRETKVEESDAAPLKKRKISSSSAPQQQTGPAGHSLLDSLKLGSDGDRIPVEFLQASNEPGTNMCIEETSLPQGASSSTLVSNSR